MKAIFAGLLVAVCFDRTTPFSRAAESAPALVEYSAGLESLTNGKWDDASAAFKRAQNLLPSDGRFMLGNAVALGLGEKYPEAIAVLARMPRDPSNRRNREPDFWTYVFETMGGFATPQHSGGRERFEAPFSKIITNEAVSMPGHMVQGGDDYPTEFASFVYYEMARNGYAHPREEQRAPDPVLTSRLKVQAARWFAGRFQASRDLAPAHLDRARALNRDRKFLESLSEIRYAQIPFPEDATLAYYTADNWLGLGRPVSARREATFALTRQTRLAAGYLARAVAAAKVGDGLRANADLAVATDLDAKEAARYTDVIARTLATNTVKGEPFTLLKNLEQAIRSAQSSATPPELLQQSQAFHRAAGAKRKRYDEDYQDRLRQLEMSIAARPKSPDPKVDLAAYLIAESRLGRRSEAVEPRRDLLPYRKHPGEKAELNRAVQLCDEAIQADAKHVRARMQKALALSRLDRDAEAEPIVDQVLALAPKNPEALRLRAQYWMDRANNLSMQAVGLRTPRTSSASHTENRSDGVYEVTTTTSYPPTDADLSRASQLDAAAAELNRRSQGAINAALEVTKGTFEGLLLLADAQVSRRETAAAEATLKKAIAERPQSREANEALVDLYLKSGRPDEADLQRATATQLVQTSCGWLLKQSWKKIVAQDFPGARLLLDKARKLDLEDARVPAYLGIIERAAGNAEEAKVQFRLALLLEDGRLALDEPAVTVGANAPHDAQEFGLAMKLRLILAESAAADEKITLYARNTAVPNLLGPGGRAVQMFSAMLPEPGAEPIPVPAPVNMATLIADSFVASGKALQAAGRTAEAQTQFSAATAYGPKAGVPNISGRNGSNYAGDAGGQSAEAFMELAKQAIKRKDFQAAANYMSQATRGRIPRERLPEANEIQMEIARGMRGW